MASTNVSGLSKPGDCSCPSQSRFGCCSCNSIISCNAYGFLCCSQLPLRRMEMQWWQDWEAAWRGNFLRMFFGGLFVVFFSMLLMSSRIKYWLGGKYAVNLRWPAAAAKTTSSLSVLSCESVITLWGRLLWELSSVWEKLSPQLLLVTCWLIEPFVDCLSEAS